MARVDSRPFGKGSVLYFAHWHGYHDVSDVEDDAADDDRSRTAENDGVDAADVRIFLFQPFQRIEFVYVHEQPGGNWPAALFESHGTAAV